jgi:hypothetical protein
MKKLLLTGVTAAALLLPAVGQAQSLEAAITSLIVNFAVLRRCAHRLPAKWDDVSLRWHVSEGWYGKVYHLLTGIWRLWIELRYPRLVRNSRRSTPGDPSTRSSVI